MPCNHAAKSVSTTGEVYCITCGQVLGFANPYRDCGCPADPFVFGHVCGAGPRPGGAGTGPSIVVSRGITLRYWG